MNSFPRVAFLLAIPIIILRCAPNGAEVASPTEPAVEEESSELRRIPSEDRPDTVDVGSWNVEWLGLTTEGPQDEALQQANVTRVLSGLQVDLMGLVEVVSESTFHDIVSALPDYDGLIVTDPRVENGAAWYRPTEQKVALVFKKRFTVESARVVLTEASTAFAGRPPMEVKLRFEEDGKPRTLVVVIAHFKAMANWDGWTRRTQASAALKTWLDATYPTRWVLVVGDLNDDIDASTYWGKTSPFSNFTADPHYRFTTEALTQSATPTTVHFSSTIDHHLATDELAARFVEGSAQVLKVDRYVTNYGDTTSDHYPVLTRYDLR
jgi:endonuclease/exonuclease/phosphatase family metal-dependent hydrolase